jgi:hypothetical protein
MGATGLSVTGSVFYNHLSNTDGSLALANEGTTLDSCFGHSDAVSILEIQPKQIVPGHYIRVALIGANLRILYVWCSTNIFHVRIVIELWLTKAPHWTLALATAML